MARRGDYRSWAGAQVDERIHSGFSFEGAAYVLLGVSSATLASSLVMKL